MPLLTQFVAALLAAAGLISPASTSHLPPAPAYAVALQQYHRISTVVAHETAARAEAARIQGIADEEASIASAQRVVVYAQTTEPVATLAPQPPRVPEPALLPPEPTTSAIRRTEAITEPPSNGVYLGEALRAALVQTPWPVELWATVESIARCESGGLLDPPHNNKHRGLMQVDPDFWGYPPPDAVGQLAQAWGVYLQQGFGAWACA